MTPLYVSSAKYTATPVRANNTFYSIGQWVKRPESTPSPASSQVWLCTTEGISDNSVPAGINNGNVDEVIEVSGLTWTRVTGSDVNYSAPFIESLTYTAIQGTHRIFADSQHRQYLNSSAETISFNESSVTYKNPIEVESLNFITGMFEKGATVISNVTSGTCTLKMQGSFIFDGVIFKAGYTGTYNSDTVTANNSCVAIIDIFSAGTSVTQRQILKNGGLILNNTFNSYIRFNASQASGGSSLKLINNDYYITSSTQTIKVYNPNVDIIGGTFLTPASTIPNIVFTGQRGYPTRFRCHGTNFSALTNTAGDKFLYQDNAGSKVAFYRCRMSGTDPLGLHSPGTGGDAGSEISFDSCTAGNIPMQNIYMTPNGVSTMSKVVYRLGGGDNREFFYSNLLSSQADKTQEYFPAQSKQIQVFINSANIERTVTVHIVNEEDYTYNNSEISIDVESMEDVDSGKYVLSSSFGNGSDLPLDSSTWVGTSGVIKKQKVSVTITPKKIGPIRVTVNLYIPNKIFYFCPEITVV